jgi:hypothetical protein
MSTRRLSTAIVFALVTPHLAFAQKRPDVNLDPGCPGLDYHGDEALAVSGSTVHAAWCDSRDGFSDVYYNRSSDRGRSWLTSAVRIDTGSDAGARDSSHLRLAASGDSVCAVWVEDDTRVHANRSLDGGSTWLPAAVPVGADSGFRAASMQLVATRDAFYAVWSVSSGTGECSIVFSCSLDGGGTWTVKGIAHTTSFTPTPVALAATESGVFVTWSERDFARSDVFCASSRDRGMFWTVRRLDAGDPPGASNSGGSHVVADGMNACVVWMDERDGRNDIYFARSIDGGLSWTPEVRLDRGTAPGEYESERPKLVLAWPEVYAHWNERRGRRLDPADAYFTRSLDGGATWARSEERLVRDARVAPVTMLATGSSVLAGWPDWIDRSLDRGLTWLPAPVRFASGPPCCAGMPTLASVDSCVYSIWIDWRDGIYSGIYFTLVLGDQPYGTGLPGTGGITPELRCAGQASIGAALEVSVALGRGGAPAFLALGFAGPADIPAFGGTLLVRPPLSVKAFVLDGPKGAPGAGSGTLVLPVPADVRLLGQRLQIQAAVSDLSAVQGVALTAAIESWIL